MGAIVGVIEVGSFLIARVGITLLSPDSLVRTITLRCQIARNGQTTRIELFPRRVEFEGGSRIPREGLLSELPVEL